MKPEKQTLHFRGRIITVSTDEVVLPNGYKAELEVVRHPGEPRWWPSMRRIECACSGNTAMSRTDGSGELPAGKLEPNEPPLITAQRELVEEAGVSAQHWESLDSYFSSPGIFTEILHLYLATGITPAVASLESAEVIEVHWMPFAEALEWAMNGTIRDGKTLIGLMRAHHMRTTRKAADSTYRASP